MGYCSRQGRHLASGAIRFVGCWGRGWFWPCFCTVELAPKGGRLVRWSLAALMAPWGGSRRSTHGSAAEDYWCASIRMLLLQLLQSSPLYNVGELKLFFSAGCSWMSWGIMPSNG